MDEKILFLGCGIPAYKCLEFMIKRDMNIISIIESSAESTTESPLEALAKDNFMRVFKPSSLATDKWIRKVKYMKTDFIIAVNYTNPIPEEIYSEASTGAYFIEGIPNELTDTPPTITLKAFSEISPCPTISVVAESSTPESIAEATVKILESFFETF